MRDLEQKHKENRKIDTKDNKRMNEVRKEINNLLQYEVETKARYLKQNYYDSGPKAMKLLAYGNSKQKNHSQ